MDLQTLINKAHAEWKQDPRKVREEIELVSKYGRMFNPEYLDNLTAEEFRSFLNYRNNKHWTGLERGGPEITNDMKKFRVTLRILLDETISIDERIKRIRDKSSPDYHKGFGTSYYTPVLLLVYPKKYPVVNKIVKDALERTRLYPGYDLKPEWTAYAEVVPIMRELAEKNKISLWQIDWVWWALNSTLDYKDLNDFIIKTMDTKTNYPSIMIRTLLEEGISSKETIEQKIREENTDVKSNFEFTDLYEVLVGKHKIAKMEPNGYKLNLIQPLTIIERDKLINLCNQEVERIKEYQVLLHKNVSEKHLNILKKFHKLRGNYVGADEIYGEKKAGQIKKSPLPPDEIVDESHYMHNLITGVYWLSGENIALSIQLNPKSKWDLEVDRNHPTLRINYDFGSDPKYKSQIKKLESCFKDDIPVGIIFKTVKAKNKILGLGKVVSYDSTKFVIDSYGIPMEDSRLLKEETNKF